MLISDHVMKHVCSLTVIMIKLLIVRDADRDVFWHPTGALIPQLEAWANKPKHVTG